LFWIISTLLFVLALLFVLLPIIRHNNTAVAGLEERNAANLSIYKERLAEIRAELQEGHIDQAQFEALAAELSRTLLSDVGDHTDQPVAPTTDTGSGNTGWLSPARLIPLVMALAVLPLSVWLYGLWGYSTDLQVAQIFERSGSAQGDPEQIRDLIFELGEVIERDRENGWAWYFLARNLVSLGQFEQAAVAFERASDNIEHPQDRAVVLGQYAQAQYIADGQQMTAAVMQIIDDAQRLNPSEPAVLQLLGADAYVNNDFQSALTYWQRLLNMTPAGSEDGEFLRMMIADAQAQLMQQSSPNTDPMAAAPQIQVSLSLSPDLDVPDDTRVFVSAQDSARPGPPLAAKLLTAGDLPLVVDLSDADAVGPFNLSSASEVVVVATVSLGGTADVQSGDFQARSGPVMLDHDSEPENPARIQMLISEPVP
jgi:cytochrome c-type biogenesis protein CcmH